MSVGLSDQMVAAARRARPRHELPATPETCFWGFFDRDRPPVLSIRSGDVVRVEAVTHHAGAHADLLMDDAIRRLWAASPNRTAAPAST